MALGLIGIKRGMMRVYGENGQAIPVTSTFVAPRFDGGAVRVAPHLDHTPT